MNIMLVFLLYMQNTKQTFNNQIPQIANSSINPLCLANKPQMPLNCQPHFTTPNNYSQLPLQNYSGTPQILKPEPIISPIHTAPLNPQTVSLQTQNIMIPNNNVNAYAQYHNSPNIMHNDPLLNQSIYHSPIPLRSGLPSLPLLNSRIPHAGMGKSLSNVLDENSIAKMQLVKFLEYNGVQPPWDPLLDFETTQHHQLPVPEYLFKKVRCQLLIFDKVKTSIVESLIVIEKYINRGKAYLAEDLKDLCRYKTLLSNILKRLRSRSSLEFRSELFRKYTDVKQKSNNTVQSFFKLRNWLLNVKKLFSTL